jgi:hypothetical protein
MPEQTMTVLDQIAELEARKQELIEQARDDALARAEAAISELKRLGFTYQLTGGPPPTSKKRDGIRAAVLQQIQATPGISRQQLLEASGAATPADVQSLSNALAALKRAGTITAENGIYHPKTPAGTT